MNWELDGDNYEFIFKNDTSGIELSQIIPYYYAWY